MAGELVGLRQDMERLGMRYVGSVWNAHQQGHRIPRGCEQAEHPATEEELAHPEYYAMLAACYADLCIEDGGGRRRRPCIPVFFRGEAAGHHSLL